MCTSSRTNFSKKHIIEIMLCPSLPVKTAKSFCFLNHKIRHSIGSFQAIPTKGITALATFSMKIAQEVSLLSHR